MVSSSTSPYDNSPNRYHCKEKKFLSQLAGSPSQAQLFTGILRGQRSLNFNSPVLLTGFCPAMTSSALVVKSSNDLAAKPCHTCRRRRVTCDRAYPSCQKCKKSGQECLGYDKLFRWTHGVASRGKLASGTMTMFRTTQSSTGEDEKPPTPRTLVDPLFQDVESSHRLYLSYCKSFFFPW